LQQQPVHHPAQRRVPRMPDSATYRVSPEDQREPVQPHPQRAPRSHGPSHPAHEEQHQPMRDYRSTIAPTQQQQRPETEQPARGKQREQRRRDHRVGRHRAERGTQRRRRG
jgi:hypothetical protein